MMFRSIGAILLCAISVGAECPITAGLDRTWDKTEALKSFAEFVMAEVGKEYTIQCLLKLAIGIEQPSDFCDGVCFTVINALATQAGFNIDAPGELKFIDCQKSGVPPYPASILLKLVDELVAKKSIICAGLAIAETETTPGQDGEKKPERKNGKPNRRPSGDATLNAACFLGTMSFSTSHGLSVSSDPNVCTAGAKTFVCEFDDSSERCKSKYSCNSPELLSLLIDNVFGFITSTDEAQKKSFALALVGNIVILDPDVGAALALDDGPASSPTSEQCNWVLNNRNTDGEMMIGAASSPEECIAMVRDRCPAATIANLPKEGSGGCWCQYGTDMNADPSSSFQACLLSTLGVPAPTGSPAAPTGSPTAPAGSPTGSTPTGSPAAPTGSPTAPAGSPTGSTYEEVWTGLCYNGGTSFATLQYSGQSYGTCASVCSSDTACQGFAFHKDGFCKTYNRDLTEFTLSTYQLYTCYKKKVNFDGYYLVEPAFLLGFRCQSLQWKYTTVSENACLEAIVNDNDPACGRTYITWNIQNGGCGCYPPEQTTCSPVSEASRRTYYVKKAGGRRRLNEARAKGNTKRRAIETATDLLAKAKKVKCLYDAMNESWDTLKEALVLSGVPALLSFVETQGGDLANFAQMLRETANIETGSNSPSNSLDFSNIKDWLGNAQALVGNGTTPAGLATYLKTSQSLTKEEIQTQVLLQQAEAETTGPASDVGDRTSGPASDVATSGDRTSALLPTSLAALPLGLAALVY